MIHRKRIQALTRTSLAVFIGIALHACGASTHPAPSAQGSDRVPQESAGEESTSALPVVIITAPRLSSPPPMAEQTSSRATAKRRS
jgi:hypothetical protein